VRLLENAHPGLPRVGTSLRLRDDPIRFAQTPSLSFAPAALASFKPSDGNAPPTLTQRFFGLFGANGPLPLHMTEYARERARRMPSDRALVRFLDMFHHRLLSLLYRAWAEAQPAVSLDRPDNDPFSRWIGSLAGYGQPTLIGRDSVPDGARLAAVGILGRSVHGAEGLERILNDFFRVPVRVHQWQPHWMRLPEDAHSRIGLRNAPVALGQNAIVGAKVWDCQTRFRIEIGPLSLEQYQRFLPGGQSMRRLRDWVLNYVGHELSCEMHLLLRKDEVPPVRLGGTGALGWTSWLGTRRGEEPAGDLVLGIT
jgi:type VI secretion system protein ImpH